MIGIYKHMETALNDRRGGGFPVFSTLIEANHVSKRDDEFAAQVGKLGANGGEGIAHWHFEASLSMTARQ